MGTFAETAIIDYNLLCADQGNKLPFSLSVFRKQTEVCRFRFPFAENKKKLPFSIRSVLRSGNRDIYMRHVDMETSSRKRNPGQFSLIHLLFALCANGSLSFAFCWRNKRRLSICKWTKRTKQTIVITLFFLMFLDSCMFWEGANAKTERQRAF